MRAIIQRVSSASLNFEHQGEAVTRRIGAGMLALVGVQRGDNQQSARRMAERLLAYRIFTDRDGRMNLNLQARGGALLIVPNFTIAADTARGTRASFSDAAAPADGERLFGALGAELRQRHAQIESGIFGADMQISLTNDGPVTFILES
jgi:D-tyrosyl-tRNA(Tyr) deacylase